LRRGQREGSPLAESGPAHTRKEMRLGVAGLKVRVNPDGPARYAAEWRACALSQSGTAKKPSSLRRGFFFFTVLKGGATRWKPSLVFRSYTKRLCDFRLLSL